MNEIWNIISDIRGGALPVSEIPGFLAWLFKKFAIISLIVIFCAFVAYIVTQ